MSADKKIYPQAVLKHLPAEKQDAIVEHLDGDGLREKPHSLKAGVAWLRSDGINTSTRALSEFRSWHLLRRQLEANQKSATEMAAECKEAGWIKTAEEEQAAGQVFFTRLAMQQQDPEQWLMIQRSSQGKTKLELVREKLTLDRQKFRRATCELFLDWSADKRAAEIASSPASNADKIEKLGELMFGEDWKS